MSKILQELDELLANQVISPDVASDIRTYYARDKSQGTNRMLIAFGILGSLLVGLGIILIIAHNWDQFPNFAKLAVSFLPLLATQIIAFKLIRDQSISVAWREGVAVAMVCAIGASIVITSQVYHRSGDLASFLLVWMSLTLPVSYLLKSSAASLLFIAGISWYAVEYDYNGNSEGYALFYWLGLLAIAPRYIYLVREKAFSNQTFFHHWFIAISIIVCLATLATHGDMITVMTYFSLASIFLLVGQMRPFQELKTMSNGWLVLGSLGTVGMLLTFTFEEIWNGVNEGDFGQQELFLWCASIVVAAGLLYHVGSNNGFRNVLTKSYTFIVIPLLVLLALQNPRLAQVFTNVLTLVLGILTVREGAKADKLWQMNYGLLIISALIVCRFFDTDLTFVVRGVLFMLVGIAFFGVNYWVVRQRKARQAS
jgi:uncharacterized membrane protein